MGKKERIEYVDIAKGYLILLVVLGHLLPESVVKTWIYSFHIPAFFALSGITSNYSHSFQLNPLSFIGKRASSILRPFFLFELLGALGRGIRFGFHQRWKAFFGDFITLYFNNTVDWFLFALFFSELIHYYLKKKSIYSGHSQRNIIYIYISCLLLGTLLPSGHFFAVLSWILLGTGFMGLGSLYEKTILKYSQNLAVIVIVAFMLVVNAIYFGRVSIYDHQLRNPVLFLVMGFAGTLLVLGVSENLKPPLIRDIGRCSLWIMGTHLPLRNIIYALLDGVLPEYSLIILTLVLVILINLGIRRIKLDVVQR